MSLPATTPNPIEPQAAQYVWLPQPGPQWFAVNSDIDEVFFGGTRGGGKSDALLGRHLIGAQAYKHAWNGLILRRKYKDFAELRRRIDELIRAGLEAERIGGENQVNHLRFANGATVTLAAMMRLEMANDWVGHQFTEISIDEATKIPFYAALVDQMWGCLRSPAGVPCRLFATGNPGGPGHGQVKARYIEIDGQRWPPRHPYRDPVTGTTRVFWPSRLQDNVALIDADPQYARRLQSITDPVLRAAWLDGDWDVVLDAAFTIVPDWHVCDPVPVPESAPLYMTYDWGFGKPFSIGWWWIDADGRVYRFAEWYGWTGAADVGLRLADSDVAQGILEREAEWSITGRPITRLAGNDCFCRKPNTQQGGQSPSTAEVFARYGIALKPGNPDRVAKIRQFRERLRLPKDEQGRVIERPMMVIYRTCKQFLRTVPQLCLDEANPEDVDTAQEDHVYDEAALLALARPLTSFDTRLAPGAPGQTSGTIHGARTGEVY